MTTATSGAVAVSWSTSAAPSRRARARPTVLFPAAGQPVSRTAGSGTVSLGMPRMLRTPATRGASARGGRSMSQPRARTNAFTCSAPRLHDLRHSVRSEDGTVRCRDLRRPDVQSVSRSTHRPTHVHPGFAASPPVDAAEDPRLPLLWFQVSRAGASRRTGPPSRRRPLKL